MRNSGGAEKLAIHDSLRPTFCQLQIFTAHLSYATFNPFHQHQHCVSVSQRQNSQGSTNKRKAYTLSFEM